MTGSTAEQDELEITLDPEPSTPLEQVADVMARLLDSCPDTEAEARGTRVIARSAGVEVMLNVLSVSADALDVLTD